MFVSASSVRNTRRAQTEGTRQKIGAKRHETHRGSCAEKVTALNCGGMPCPANDDLEPFLRGEHVARLQNATRRRLGVAYATGKRARVGQNTKDRAVPAFLQMDPKASPGRVLEVRNVFSTQK